MSRTFGGPTGRTAPRRNLCAAGVCRVGWDGSCSRDRHGARDSVRASAARFATSPAWKRAEQVGPVGPVGSGQSARAASKSSTTAWSTRSEQPAPLAGDREPGDATVVGIGASGRPARAVSSGRSWRLIVDRSTRTRRARSETTIGPCRSIAAERGEAGAGDRDPGRPHDPLLLAGAVRGRGDELGELEDRAQIGARRWGCSRRLYVCKYMGMRTDEHYTIISADCHAGGSHEMYRGVPRGEVPRRLRRLAREVQEPVP